MSTTQVVRPAGAGHETLYVLLLCLKIGRAHV